MRRAWPQGAEGSADPAVLVLAKYLSRTDASTFDSYEIVAEMDKARRTRSFG